MEIVYLPNKLNYDRNLIIFGDFNKAIEKKDRKSWNIDRRSKLMLELKKINN